MNAFILWNRLFVFLLLYRSQLRSLLAWRVVINNYWKKWCRLKPLSDLGIISGSHHFVLACKLPPPTVICRRNLKHVSTQLMSHKLNKKTLLDTQSKVSYAITQSICIHQHPFHQITSQIIFSPENEVVRFPPITVTQLLVAMEGSRSRQLF